MTAATLTIAQRLTATTLTAVMLIYTDAYLVFPTEVRDKLCKHKQRGQHISMVMAGFAHCKVVKEY